MCHADRVETWAGIGGALPVTGTPLTRSVGFIGVLSKVTPHAYAVEGYYTLMAENGTLVQVLPEIGILVTMAVIFCLIAVSRFKFE